MNPEIERIEKAGVTLFETKWDDGAVTWSPSKMTTIYTESVEHRALPLPDMTTLLALARKGEEAVDALAYAVSLLARIEFCYRDNLAWDPGLKEDYVRFMRENVSPPGEGGGGK